jgi:pimeloyl-ACP methyl ester carboxylesterase
MKLLLLKRSFSLCISAWILALSASTSAAAPLNFERCQIQFNATEIDAECATLTRPENPTKNNGKTIDLFVAKLPSTSPSPAEDAFTLIQGGPGGSSVDMTISYSAFLDIIRSKRDIIVLDQRGTGRSNKLNCELDDDAVSANAFDPIVTAQLTRDCVAKLKDHDLGSYTTSVAVQDLDALRTAAGYSQLSIYGVSYGTRVAQHYLRRYPQNTRTLIIDGVVDVGLNLAGAEIARRSQDAFDQMVNRCNQTPSCKDKFGDVAQQFTELRQRLKAQPVEVTVAHPNTGKSQTVTISDNDLLVAVRLMPYSTEGVSLLPLLINNAYLGNYTSLAVQSIIGTESISEGFAMGMHNSVMCTEDAPYVNSNAAEQAKDTYFGSMMIDSMRVTCQNWPKGIIDKDFLETFESDVPVLILSGETDPITPPQNGERASKMFKNSKHLVVPSHGHGVVGRGCVPFLVKDFLLNANLDDIKADCIDRENSMPFFIDPTGPKP